MPEHVQSLLTSKEYTSVSKFIEVAKNLNRVRIVDGVEEFEDPYKSHRKRAFVRPIS